VGVSVCLTSRVEAEVGGIIPSVVRDVAFGPPPRLNGRLVHPTIVIRSPNDNNRIYRMSIKMNGTT
jgi:hypothetical protein